MKMRDVSPTSVAVAARNRKVWDTEELEKLEREVSGAGCSLALAHDHCRSIGSEVCWWTGCWRKNNFFNLYKREF